VLIARYPEGAAIGWHRDAPMFDPTVLGISLRAKGVMRFRRDVGVNKEIFKIELEPKSFYIISGSARTHWQHSLAPTKELRYSITFRTVKAGYRSAQSKKSDDDSQQNLLTS
jgi:alkylated DNA repair dioxygenase AlkB